MKERNERRLERNLYNKVICIAGIMSWLDELQHND